MTKRQIKNTLNKLKRNPRFKTNRDLADTLGITERYVWGMLREEYDHISPSLEKLIDWVSKFSNI